MVKRALDWLARPSRQRKMYPWFDWLWVGFRWYCLCFFKYIKSKYKASYLMQGKVFDDAEDGKVLDPPEPTYNLNSNDIHVDVTDEYYCEYDSTWETSACEKVTHRQRRNVQHHSHRFHMFRNAARDMQRYRCDYPGHENLSTGLQQQDCMTNLKFYLGDLRSNPDGVYIWQFHNDWFGDYARLERGHSFIQWLFPLQEPGLNDLAKELTKEEIKAFLGNETAKKNLFNSYILMLHFYGIKLSDEKTGKVQHAENWEERFRNLDRNTHNNLRITRILKCLGTLGFPHYQAPLVQFFLEETLVHGRLNRVKESVLNYFMFAVRNKRQRRELVSFAYKHYEPKQEFLWCPRKIQMMLSALPNSQGAQEKKAESEPSRDDSETMTNTKKDSVSVLSTEEKNQADQ